MDIKVLGPGCLKCGKQYDEARKAIELAGVDATLEKVERIDVIASYGVLFTPAVVIDGEVKASGSVVKAAKLADIIKGVGR